MPAVGGRNLQIVIAPHMATRARNVRVSVSEREVDGGSRMVYGSSEPTVERVARLARLRELRLHVVGNRSAERLRTIPIGLVTRNAGRGQPLELAHRRTLVTVFALQGRMCS